MKITFPLALLALCFSLSACSNFFNEMRIRKDPLTIVRPDVEELEAMEKADGTWTEPAHASGGIQAPTLGDPNLQLPSPQPTATRGGTALTPIKSANQGHMPAPPVNAGPAPLSPQAPPQPPQYDPAIIEELR